jgi:hypothetical protein
MAEARVSVRRRVRKPQPLPVEFQLVGATERQAGTLTSLTLAGALIKSDLLPEAGKRLRVFVLLIGAKEELSLRAIVRWERGGCFGVQFWRLGEKEIYVLMDILATMDRAVKLAAKT